MTSSPINSTSSSQRRIQSRRKNRPLWRLTTKFLIFWRCGLWNSPQQGDDHVATWRCSQIRAGPHQSFTRRAASHTEENFHQMDEFILNQGKHTQPTTNLVISFILFMLLLSVIEFYFLNTTTTMKYENLSFLIFPTTRIFISLPFWSHRQTESVRSIWRLSNHPSLSHSIIFKCYVAKCRQCLKI